MVGGETLSIEKVTTRIVDTKYILAKRTNVQFGRDLHSYHVEEV